MTDSSYAVVGGAEDIGRYEWPARWLHWAIALLVLSVIPLGFLMGAVGPGPLQNWLFYIHEELGFVVLVLMALRLVFRIGRGAPPLPPGIPRWQHGASHLVHGLFYLCLLVQPILGWLGTSAFGAPVSIFGLFTLPMPLAKDDALAGQLFEIHETIGFVIIGLLLVHIGAVVMHSFVQKDGVIRRMWPV
ncbi:cytochrome b [Acuticoccus kandeliae]|uniref:cytochrome b n=1 Tax=Acuticoccus kandeliae TaxID=2073160 RepID=UPI000D3E7F3C|nr:cytochrome b [Acuticoccus kandeliae]